MYIKKKGLFSKIVLLLVITLISCKKTSYTADKSLSIAKFEKSHTLNFENLYDFPKGTVEKLKVKDSTLIIFNSNGVKDFFFYNYSLRNNRLSKGYLGGGRGPNEVLGVIDFGIYDSMFWAYDISLKKILTLNFENLDVNNEITNNFSLTKNFYGLDFINQNTLIGVGEINSSSKFHKVDLLSSKTIKEYGLIDIPNNISINSYNLAYQSKILTHPSDSKIVIVYKYADDLEIFNLVSNTNLKVYGPKGLKINKEQLKTGNINSKTLRSYIDSAVTNKYIYLLYSGKPLFKSNSLTSNIIYVYDWNGKPIKEILCNKEISNMTVSKDDKIIYATDSESGVIVKAKLI